MIAYHRWKNGDDRAVRESVAAHWHCVESIPRPQWWREIAALVHAHPRWSGGTVSVHAIRYRVSSGRAGARVPPDARGRNKGRYAPEVER